MFGFSAKSLILWSKVICVISVLFMFIGATQAVYRWNYLTRAVRTHATIIELIEKTTEDGGVAYTPVYVFPDQQGRSVKIKSSISSFPPPGEVGDKIEVLFDPENPKNSIQNTFFSVWGMAAIFGGIGAVYSVVFGAVVIFMGRRVALVESSCPQTSHDKAKSLGNGWQWRDAGGLHE